MSDKIERAQFSVGERVDPALDVFFKLVLWSYLYKNDMQLVLDSKALPEKTDGIMPVFDLKTTYEDEESLEGIVTIRAILVPDEVHESKGVIH